MCSSSSSQATATSTISFSFVLFALVTCLSILRVKANFANDSRIIIAISLNESARFLKEGNNSNNYSALPLVGKCCPLGEVISKNEKNNQTQCIRSSAVKFEPLFHDYNASGVFTPGTSQLKFVAVVGDPCQNKRYILDPDESRDDLYYLMSNGSIYAPNHDPMLLQPGHDYCMETIPELGLRPLVCFPKDSTTDAEDKRVTFYAIGLLISVPFLLLTAVAYAITPRLRDVHGRALCRYCICLTVAFLSLAIAQLATDLLSNQLCTSIAFIIQFSFVCCFFWLNVMCIETWLMVRRHVDARQHQTSSSTSPKMDPNRLFHVYSLWAWGPPAVLVLVTMTMQLNPTIPMTFIQPSFGSERCWFKSDKEAMPYFYVPIGLLVLANVILYVLTAVELTKQQRDLDLRRLARNQQSDREEARLFRRMKRTFVTYMILFFLMGLNWVMELVSWWLGGDPLKWSAFDLINALQGVLVFVLFVLRRPARDFILYRLQNRTPL